MKQKWIWWKLKMTINFNDRFFLRISKSNTIDKLAPFGRFNFLWHCRFSNHLSEICVLQKWNLPFVNRFPMLPDSWLRKLLTSDPVYWKTMMLGSGTTCSPSVDVQNAKTCILDCCLAFQTRVILGNQKWLKNVFLYCFGVFCFFFEYILNHSSIFYVCGQTIFFDWIKTPQFIWFLANGPDTLDWKSTRILHKQFRILTPLRVQWSLISWAQKTWNVYAFFYTFLYLFVHRPIDLPGAENLYAAPGYSGHRLYHPVERLASPLATTESGLRSHRFQTVAGRFVSCPLDRWVLLEFWEYDIIWHVSQGRPFRRSWDFWGFKFSHVEAFQNALSRIIGTQKKLPTTMIWEDQQAHLANLTEQCC